MQSDKTVKWFDWCFENSEKVNRHTILKKIPTDTILSFKGENQRGSYSLGGFYMIKNIHNGMSYVGKSTNVCKRIKNHYKLSQCNRGIYIDTQMRDCVDDFEFYIISFYTDIGIDFFTRKLEVPIEQYYIKTFNTSHPSGYNKRIYESISVKSSLLGLLL